MWTGQTWSNGSEFLMENKCRLRFYCLVAEVLWFEISSVDTQTNTLQLVSIHNLRFVVGLCCLGELFTIHLQPLGHLIAKGIR